MLSASGFSTSQLVHTSSISLQVTSPLGQAQKHRLILQMTEGVMSVPEDGHWREDSCFFVVLLCVCVVLHCLDLFGRSVLMWLIDE